ncbi:MAG: 16S rRNA (cytosine(1402)-N(4))-methyltransferase RsmH [Verrucomicrobia bacterium]|nr:16S rRNA (cytosine(1402)-N(4))-methyltransferase RsmH [Cytophagales bacterium]
MPAYHVPVMLNECLEGLDIKPEGVYVDVTFGGGGHSQAIADRLTTGKLFAFDQDEAAAANTAWAVNNFNFQLIQANFRYLTRFLKLHNVTAVDGILADLGISSHQIDAGERGFSTRFEATLDMRMDDSPGISKTASTVVNEYSEADLHKLLGMYGEVTNAKTLANALVRERMKQKINTTQELKRILQAFAPRGKENKYFAQVFQALRIEVNDELKALEEMLLQIPVLLKPSGRLVVMSYHSLEDRLVKSFIQKGKFSGELEKDIFGNVNLPLTAVNRKVIVPSEAEIEKNPRSRSAKLRIAEKIV